MSRRQYYEKMNQSPYLVMRAAYLYYCMDWSQGKIAEALGVSGTTVSRLIAKAKEEKVIRVVIRDPYMRYISLSERLKQRFGIREALIAPGSGDTDMGLAGEKRYSPKEAVALEGSRYLQRVLKPEDVVGVTGGTTIHAMLKFLNSCVKTDAEFITLYGNVPSYTPEMDARPITTNMARIFGGSCKCLTSDALLDSPESVAVLKEEKRNRPIFDMFPRVTMTVTGIGAFYPVATSILTKPGVMKEEDLRILHEAGVRGNIALRFFDQNGRECETSLKDRIFGIDLEEYAKIPRKMTLAAGVEKAESVSAALKGGLIDVLIVDDLLAEKILEVSGK